jgi:molybdopterin-guanine dinucleotide biosynthesis protein A
MLKLILICCVLLSILNMPAHAVIKFKDGWDAPANSNVHQYNEEEATTYLRNKSDALKAIIDGPQACVLEVTKGCHQPGDAHFTVNGAQSKPTCKVNSVYVGSKSDHVKCP